MRKWFEYQFEDGANWENFGKYWQFEHIIPVTYFDFSIEKELRMCWNFTNIRVEHFQKNKDRGSRLNVLAAKKYFKELFETTKYQPCLNLLHKIDEIELLEIVNTQPQQSFIKDHWDYLQAIENYSAFEFELLNSGRSIEEIKKELDLFKK